MTPQEFEKSAQELLNYCYEIRSKKSPDYAEDSDALDNFKRDAVEFGVSKFQAWALHWNKHIRSIKKFVKNGRVESEPIKGRIADAINYLTLLNALIEEDNATTTPGQ